MKVSRIDNIVTILVEDAYDASDLTSALTSYNDEAMYHSCRYCGAGVPVLPEDHNEDCLVRMLEEAERTFDNDDE